jgi:serine protease
MTGSKTGSVTAQYVYCNIGRPEDFPASVAGKIALIKRGDLTFGEKAKNAMNAGASAIVIFNKDTSALNFTLIGADCDATGNNCVNKPEDVVFGWPLVVAIGQADGETLAATPTGGTLTVSAVADDYGSKSGTSMATPHVAGVAALVKNAIEQTAADLGNAGRDVTFGFGLVDALSAAKQLSPQSFGVGGSPEPPANVPTKGGRTILRRGSH